MVVGENLKKRLWQAWKILAVLYIYKKNSSTLVIQRSIWNIFEMKSRGNYQNYYIQSDSF